MHNHSKNVHSNNDRKLRLLVACTLIFTIFIHALLFLCVTQNFLHLKKFYCVPYGIICLSQVLCNPETIWTENIITYIAKVHHMFSFSKICVTSLTDIMY
jgi:hypothetical protein